MLKKKIFYKLYLGCRRGILELDIILINFLEVMHLKSNYIFLKKFNRLLKQSDEMLYNWIIRGILCEDIYFKDIVIEINKFKQHMKFN